MTSNGSGSRNSADLTVILQRPHERKRTQKQVEAIRAGLASIPGADVSLGRSGRSSSRCSVPDPVVLDREVTRLYDKIAKIKGITDLESSVKPGLPAYAVRIKADAARELGLTPTQLASSLRSFVNGDVATYWTAPDGEQVEVEIRLPQPMRENISQLDNLPVAYARDGTPIALSRVANMIPVINPEVIKRQDLQRRQAIYAGVTGRPSGDVSKEITKLVDATVLPPGYRFDMGGQTRDQGRGIQRHPPRARRGGALHLHRPGLQFGSFLQPFAIMASLPLALIGVMLALLLTHSTLNLFSMIGLVMLMGLVTKNAILLVDYATHVRKTGLGVAEALLQAAWCGCAPS